MLCYTCSCYLKHTSLHVPIIPHSCHFDAEIFNQSSNYAHVTHYRISPIFLGPLVFAAGVKTYRLATNTWVQRIIFPKEFQFSNKRFLGPEKGSIRWLNVSYILSRKFSNIQNTYIIQHNCFDINPIKSTFLKHLLASSWLETRWL